MSRPMAKLPYGVGEIGMRFWLLVLLMGGVIALGIYAYAHEVVEGLVSTGMRNIGVEGGAAWGLYITFDMFFVGVAFTGIMLPVLARLFRIEAIEPVSRVAALLSLVALALAGTTVVADLGRSAHGLMYLPKFARPMSPFYGTFTLVVAGYSITILVYLYLTSRRDASLCAKVPSRLRWLHRFLAAGYRDTPGERMRHERTMWWFSLLASPALVTACSTLGFVFGIQVGRPGWYGTLQAPAFVTLAAVSGLGVLLVVVPLVRWVAGLERVVDARVYAVLGNFLWVTSAIYLYLMMSESLTTSYAGREIEQRIVQSLMSGVYAPLFYTSLAGTSLGFLLPFVSFVSRRWTLWTLIPAGIFANVGVVLKRYLLVVSSQTHGSLLGDPPGAHHPHWGEYAVIAGLCALGVLLYSMFMKAFPIARVEAAAQPHPEDDGAPDDDPGRRRRLALFWITVVAGVSLAVAGFSLSPGDVPRSGMPYAPVVFIVGVMFTCWSAVVYEIVRGPRRKKGRAESR